MGVQVTETVGERNGTEGEGEGVNWCRREKDTFVPILLIASFVRIFY